MCNCSNVYAGGEKRIIMKEIRILQVLFSSSLMLLVSGDKTVGLPKEGILKWNIDLNDMLSFTKSSVNEDAEDSKENQETIQLEDQLLLLSDKIRLVKKFNLIQKQAQQYVRRYINLLLVKCGLQDVPESDEDIKVDLEFFISKDDLVFLKNLSNDLNQQKLHDSLQRLDTILDRGLRVKEESFYMKTWSFMCVLATYLRIPSSWYYSKIFYYVLVLVLTLVLALFINYRGISNAVIILVIINNLLLLEGILDYLNKLKEAETEDRVRFLRAHNEIDVVCNPSKQTFWSSIAGWFKEDVCLEYHKALVTSKADELSPLKCILEVYNLYIFQYPFKVVGSGIRAFSESLYGETLMGQVLCYFNYIWIIPLFCGLICCLFGQRLRLSFFGAALEIGSSERNLIHRRNEVESIQDRRIQGIRDISDETGERTEKSIPVEGKETICDRAIENIGGKSHTEDGNDGGKEESSRTLLEDISAARKIVKDMKEID